MQSNGGAEGPVLNIIGEKVALGPLRRDLVPLYTKWINDFEVTRTLSYGFRPTTPEAEEDWYERASQAGSAVFTIYERATLRPIGNTDIGEIDYRHGSALFGLMIGEKDCWGKGYGTEATTLMLGYAFTVLGLHSVMLWVYSFNERGIRAYRRAGFRESGRRREAVRLGGRWYDMVLMDCLSTEFQGSTLCGLLPEG